MRNTTHADRGPRRIACAMAAAIAWATALPGHAQPAPQPAEPMNTMRQAPASETLSARQQAIVPIAATAAVGDMTRLSDALNRGLDAGLAVNEIKEVLVQVYAYAGFPRSLNALGELMKVLEARRGRGIDDAPGRLPSRRAPQGEALLAAGTANQTRLTGAPVKGALFDFAPAIDEYLKTHLFGDIFERDNLDWQSRELATVGMLAALPGVESQLQAHIRIGMNVGLGAGQLWQAAQVLAERVDADAGRRANEAIARHLASAAAPAR
ncbi:4-carboxymuconolactone decarboxylase [Variovorax sp. TBS-050B]|nr:4-carboxymuconolactone decarboxylase [Variovorax sp. TBS-050B]